MTVNVGGASPGDGGELSWDEIFQQIDAARQEAAVDPVGKLRQMRQRRKEAAVAPKPKVRSEPTRPKIPGPGALSARGPPLLAAVSDSARPKSARDGPRGRPVANRGDIAPKTARDGRPSYRPAVANGDFFDPVVGFLPNNNFDTWDKSRCALPERAWPCQGVAGTLYDTQRLGKPDWKRGDPRCKLFGLALADIGTGIAAETFIAQYIDAQQTSAPGTPRQSRPKSAAESRGVAFKAAVICEEPGRVRGVVGAKQAWLDHPPLSRGLL